MVENKIFEKYYKEKSIKVSLLSESIINVHIDRVWDNEFQDTFIECFYNEKERPKFISHDIVWYFTDKEIRHYSKIFLMNENIQVNLTKV